MFVVKVVDVIKHTPKIATIRFKPKLTAYPGQFVMVNVFGYEEIPLSLSSQDSVTVKAVGETTSAMLDLKVGSKIGIRGPFGRPFTPTDKALLIAGGIGIAPLRFLYHYLKACGASVNLIYGAKTANELVFREEFGDAIFLTEDGSLGRKGDVLAAVKDENIANYSRVYCCGKEEMMKAVYNAIDSEYLKNVEFSLERYMRCGIGVCGSCTIENGLRVCADGPVFRGDELNW